MIDKLYMEVHEETNNVMSELETKYPFFRFSNQMAQWNKLLKYFLSPENMGMRELFLRDYENTIRIYSDFCLYSRPLSVSTEKNCRVFVTSRDRYGTFKGWVHTVMESNNDYVIVEFDNFSEIVHKDNLFEIQR